MTEPSDLGRIERKVDKLMEAMEQLIRVEERQSAQGLQVDDLKRAVATLQAAHSDLDRKVEKWVNRGVGVWAVAITIWGLIQFSVSNGIIKLGG